MQQIVVMIWYVCYRTNKEGSDEIVTEYGGGVVINEDGFVFTVARAAPIGYHKVLMKLPKDLDRTEMILVDKDISRNLAIYKPKGENSQREKSSKYCKFADMNNSVREGMQIFTTCHTGGLGFSFETEEASYGATYDDREKDENERVFRTLKVQCSDYPTECFEHTFVLILLAIIISCTIRCLPDLKGETKPSRGTNCKNLHSFANTVVDIRKLAIISTLFILRLVAIRFVNCKVPTDVAINQSHFRFVYIFR